MYEMYENNTVNDHTLRLSKLPVLPLGTKLMLGFFDKSSAMFLAASSFLISI